MLTATSMELVSLAVLADRSEAVAGRLVRLRLFHPVDIRLVERDLAVLTGNSLDKDAAQWERLDFSLREISRCLSTSQVCLKEIPSFSLDETSAFIGRLQARLNPLSGRRDEAQRRIRTLENTLEEQSCALPFSLPSSHQGHSSLETTLGKLAVCDLEMLERSLAEVPHVVYPFRKTGKTSEVLLITLRRDKEHLAKVLKDLGWETAHYDTDKNAHDPGAAKRIAKEIADARSVLADIESQVAALAAEFRHELSRFYTFLAFKLSIFEARKYACATEKAAILCGWVPRDSKEFLVNAVSQLDDASYIEVRRAEDTRLNLEDVPVLLKHPGWLKPFEPLINSYGLPRYGSVDPTIFTAVSFLLMFGVMFADIGHGLSLVLAGASLYLKGKGSALKRFGALLTYCGAAALSFGALFGSFFGREFHSLLAKPIDDMLGAFSASVIFGVLMITLGIILNLTNALRDKDYFKALFDKSGLVAGLFYWFILAAAAKVLVFKGSLSVVYLCLPGVMLLVLFLKPVFELLRRRHSLTAAAFAESVIEVLEVILGYLTNTVSFIRVAAFALAHAGLFLAIFALARLASQLAAGSVAVSILVAGNILIILLEGLVVSIQSLRLNYYEFFSRFFLTGKQGYKPLTI